MNAGVIVADVAFAVWAYPQLPEEVATHFNMAGEADGWSSPEFAAFFFPGLIVATWVLMLLSPRIDPRRRNYERFGPSFAIIRGSLVCFLAFIHVITLGMALGWPVDVSAAVLNGVGVLLAIIGNQLPRIRHTYLVGIRTPWTLASETVWRRTHRLAGPIWLVGGLSIAITGLFTPSIARWAFAICLAAMVGVPTVASYLWWREEEQGAA